MKLKLKRTQKNSDNTIGELFVDNNFFCYTCEDKDRGLDSSMSIDNIKKIKVHGKTAIPYGVYNITLNIVSSKYSDFVRYKWAKACEGKLPRLLDVPGWEGVLIHVGNYAEDTEGCILVGDKKLKNGVGESTKCFTRLYELLLKNKENLSIEIES